MSLRGLLEIGPMLQRSINGSVQALATSLRMYTVTPTSGEDGIKRIFRLKEAKDLRGIATGTDEVLGGASKMQLVIDESEGNGRFFGKLSTHLPRNAQIDRSGYAGMRTSNRWTLFGVQTWDLQHHPFLHLRVRNRLASRAESPANFSAIPAMIKEELTRDVSSPQNSSSVTVNQIIRNAHARLGSNSEGDPPPKFFVNVQTDGPVTSDVWQHRIPLDPGRGNEWQDVFVNLNNFMHINSGELSPFHMAPMMEAIRTIGISATIESPPTGHLEEIVRLDKEERRVAGATTVTPTDDERSHVSFVEEIVDEERDLRKEREQDGVRPAVLKPVRPGVELRFDLSIDFVQALSTAGLQEYFDKMQTPQ